MSTPDDFEWCEVRWDGPGGKFGNGKNHICSEHNPGHTIHICCCDAVKEET